MSEYRVIDISAWTQVGQGGNGTTYENPSQPDLILKVDKKQINTLEFVKHEFDVSKAVENLGLPTPKMHEMVRVGDLYPDRMTTVNLTVRPVGLPALI